MRTSTRLQSILTRLLLLPIIALFLGSCSEGVNNPQTISDIRFTIQKVVPYYGSPGSVVRIEGYGFGDGKDLKLKVGGVQIDPTSINDEVIFFTVPPGLTSGGISITRATGSSSISRSTDFTLLNSPFPHNAFEIDIAGITARRKHDLATDEGVSKLTIDTAEISFELERWSTGDPEELGVPLLSSGNTIRINSHELRSAVYAGSDAYDRSDERAVCEAVIDSVHGLMKIVKIQWNFSALHQESALNSNSTVIGTTLILRDLPYQRDADGTMHISLEGEAIRDHIVSYNSSYAHNKKSESGWSNENGLATDLIGFSDDAKLEFKLYRRP